MRKPVSQYTFAGLLYVAAQDKDPARRAMATEELRNRQRAKQAAKDARFVNAAAKAAVYEDLTAEGLKARAAYDRREADKALFAAMQDVAFESVDLMALPPGRSAVRAFNRELSQKAYTLYREVKEKNRELRRDAARRSLDAERASFYENKPETVDENAVTDWRLIGRRVNVMQRGKVSRTGDILRITYYPRACRYVAVVTCDGCDVACGLRAVEPVDPSATFHAARKALLALENADRKKKTRAVLLARKAALENKIQRLDEYDECDL